MFWRWGGVFLAGRLDERLFIAGKMLWGLSTVARQVRRGFPLDERVAGRLE
jgi:hypothetical protein